MSKVAGVLGFAAIASATWASSSSAAAPAASSALPECWSSCFASNGVTSESAACGNTALDACIHDTCSEELDQKYWSWYDSYCGSSSSSAVPISTYVPSSSSYYSRSSEAGPWSSSVTGDGSSSSYPGWGSSSSAAYPVSSSSSWGPWSSSSYYPSSDGSPISSSYYPSYSSSFYPSSSVAWPVSSSTVPSGTPTPTCWSECFQKAGITDESELCGNTEVDKCIHDTCCKEEDEAYWAWYDSFCPAPSSSTPFSPVSSSAYPYPSSSSYSWEVSSSEPFSPISSSEYPSYSSYSWGAVSSSIYAYPSSSACPARSSTPIWRSSYIPSSSISFEPASSSYSWGVSSSVIAYPSGSSYSWGAISSSYVPSISFPVGPASSSSYPSSTPIVDCWGKCFAENSITSEEELCGNTAVDKCISETCSCEKDKQYWQWYESFCTATPSSSLVSPTTTTAPTVPATPTKGAGCWDMCFAEASIASESELCGNTAVDQCIHDTCSPAEDKAYWQWYNAYCPATATISTITIPATTPSSPVATPTGTDGNCWATCFSEFDVTSEASLCGNDEVSKCIHDTCSGALDQAYWAWYDSYCAAASSSVTTITTTVEVTPIPSGYPAGTTGQPSIITTTIISTLTYPATAKESSPVTGFPVPPASSPAGPAGYSAPASSPVDAYGYSAPASSPVAPVGYSTPASSAAGAWGYSTGAAQPTGYAKPSASTWAPVPATGAGAANKPGFVLAVAVAFVALL